MFQTHHLQSITWALFKFHHQLWTLQQTPLLHLIHLNSSKHSALSTVAGMWLRFKHLIKRSSWLVMTGDSKGRLGNQSMVTLVKGSKKLHSGWVFILQVSHAHSVKFIQCKAFINLKTMSCSSLNPSGQFGTVPMTMLRASCTHSRCCVLSCISYSHSRLKQRHICIKAFFVSSKFNNGNTFHSTNI